MLKIIKAKKIALVFSFIYISVFGFTAGVSAGINDLKQTLNNAGNVSESSTAAGTASGSATTANIDTAAISENISRAASEVKTGAKKIGEELKGFFGELSGIFKSIFDELKGFFTNLFGKVKEIFEPVVKELENAFSGACPNTNTPSNAASQNEAASSTNVETVAAESSQQQEAAQTVEQAPARPSTEAVKPAQETAAAETEKPKPAEVDKSTPYFSQYDNSLSPGSSCQNTSIAMTLSKYGWKGNPDQITSRFGKNLAQSPDGLADVFNTLASESGLNVRIRPHTNASADTINKLLAEGKPVIVHGWFTGSGHVITLTDFDGKNYTANDPAGEWSQTYKGGYTNPGSGGKGVKYDKNAVYDAILEGGEAWAHEIYTI